MDSSLLRAQLYQSYERRETSTMPLMRWVKHNFDSETFSVFNRLDERRDILKLVFRALVLTLAYWKFRANWIGFFVTIMLGEVLSHVLLTLLFVGFYADMCALYQSCKAARKGGTVC